MTSCLVGSLPLFAFSPSTVSLLLPLRTVIALVAKLFSRQSVLPPLLVPFWYSSTYASPLSLHSTVFKGEAALSTATF